MNNMTDIKYQKPFIKWVGGKTQIIDKIIEKFPNNIENYREIFLGGGSVLFALLTMQKNNKIKINKKVYAYDININLINVYKDIQKNKDTLYNYIEYNTKIYDGIKSSEVNRNPLTLEEAMTSKESYYYWLRKRFNTLQTGDIEKSALFIFLNKTCFRGIYREGPNGFNVPYGHYKKTPVICDKDELYKISDLIKDVEFKQSDFITSFSEIESGDFVYLDPPYAPINNNSFVGYTKDGFDIKTHYKLFDEIKKLNTKAKFIMSNVKVDLITENFKEYKQEEIIAKRSINSKNPGDSVIELIIMN